MKRSVFLIGIIVLFGVLAIRTISVGYLPDRQDPRVSVLVRYDGAFANEVERTLTIPIEDAIASVDGVRSISSISRDGQTRVGVRLRRGAHLDHAVVRVLDALDRVLSDAPTTVGRPIVTRNAADTRPTFIASLPKDRFRTREEIERYFGRVEGVGRVDVAGFPQQQVVVRLREAYDTNVATDIFAVAETIREANSVVGLGGNRALPIVADTRFRTIEDFRNQRLDEVNSVGRLASVERDEREPESTSVVNGTPAVVVYVSPASGANVVRVNRALRASIGAIERSEVLFDQGSIIEDALGDALRGFAVGSVLVTVALLLITRNGRRSIAAAAALPAAAFAAFAALGAFGLPADVLAVSALAASMGFVADGAVVLAIEGSAPGVRRGLLVSTISTVVVFVPLILDPSGTGSFYIGFALVVISALVTGLVWGLFFIPAKSAGRAPEREDRTTPSPFAPSWFGRMTRAVHRMRFVVWIGILAVVGVAVWSIHDTPIGFWPELDERRTGIVVEYDAGTPRSRLETEMSNAYSVLALYDEYETIISRTDRSRISFEITHRAQPNQNTVDTLVTRVQESVQGSVFLINQAEGATRVPIHVIGNDPITTQRVASELADYLQTAVPDSTAVLNFKRPPRQAEMVVDTEAVVSTGGRPNEIHRHAYWLLSNPVGFKWLTDRETDVRFGRTTPIETADDLLRTTITPTTGRPLRLESVATVREIDRPDTIFRIDRSRASTISVEFPRSAQILFERTVDGAAPEYEAHADVRIAIDPTFFETRETGRRAIGGVVLAILFVTVSIIAGLEHVRDGLLAALVAVPSVVIPATVARFAYDGISEPVLLALLLCGGVGVNNAVVVLSAAGKDGAKSLVEVLWRKIPSLLAAGATTILGVLPLVVVGGRARGVVAPVSITLAIGTVVALAATIVVLPIGRRGKPAP